ncbi:MAG TPA: DUF4870 domain-containing protein [Actinomycetes bacterium]|nr:DUF4870 domain-containing protein [Actinomycetes bacterium]
MSTDNPPPDQPDAGHTPPPPPPPPPPAPPGLGQGLATPTVEGFPPAQQSDETVWALLAHLSFFVLSLIGPLIIMLVVGQARPFARAHAVEALNFHITVLIGVVISIILIFVVIGVFTLIAILIAGAIFTILAAIKAGQGEGYRYPLTLRLVK